MTSWTLVRHTGYSVGGKPDFEHAVEERALNTSRERAAVAKAGGLLFEHYGDAHNRAAVENYPDNYGGLVPRAPGKFVRRADLEEDIYVPA